MCHFDFFGGFVFVFCLKPLYFLHVNAGIFAFGLDLYPTRGGKSEYQLFEQNVLKLLHKISELQTFHQGGGMSIKFDVKLN